MKSPKRILVLIGAGFLAFAPPGTMIFLFLLLLGLIGNVWIVASIFCLVIAGVIWVVYRKRLLKRADSKKFTSKA